LLIRNLFKNRDINMATKPETNHSSAVTTEDTTSVQTPLKTQVETKPEGVDATTPDGEAAQPVNVTGRAVFAVETTAAGVVVRTAFLTEDSKLLNMPAVFPDLVYAMNVIDDLKRQVMQHFSQAAQVGAQVIANQARAQQQATTVSAEGDVQSAPTKG
jgi:hypothetical protein